MQIESKLRDLAARAEEDLRGQFARVDAIAQANTQ